MNSGEQAWDGVNVVYTKSAEGDVSWHPLMGLQRLAQVKQDQQGHSEGLYFTTDHLGSITQIHDSTGARVGSYRIGPYGNVERQFGVQVPFVWTGKGYDANLGLYDL